MLNIKFDVICRAIGEMYIHVDAQLPENTTLKAKSVVGSTEVLGILFENPLDEAAIATTNSAKNTSKDAAQSTNKGDSKELILIVPQFQKQTLVFEAYNEKGEVIDTYSKDLVLKYAKWTSRFNYRYHNKEAWRVRCCAPHRDLCETKIAIFDIIPQGEIDIFRGHVWLHESIDDDVEIECVTDTGEIVSSRFIVMGETIDALPPLAIEKARLVEFSMRIPRNIPLRILQARTKKDGRLLNGFETLDHVPCDIMRGAKEDLFRSAAVDGKYHDWFINFHRTPLFEFAAQRKHKFEIAPKFSIVVPVFETPIPFLKEAITSVKNQTYANWELILVNASPNNQEVCAVLNEEEASDERIMQVVLQENQGITLNTNAGVEKATGDFVCYFDHDDVLEADILFEYARAINKKPETDMLYCDEDHLNEEERYQEPFFKPDFSIDFLRNSNFVCHMLCVRKSLLDTLPVAGSEFDGAQDHHLTLEVAEKTKNIYHVAKLLYHWRMSKGSTAVSSDNKSYAADAGILAVQEHLKRLNIDATVEKSRIAFTYKVTYKVKDNPKVSIIIPSKDNTELLDICLSSIFEKTTYKNYEIIVVENNSTEKETFEYYEKIQKEHEQVRVVMWEHEFNFSKIINFGVSHAQGDYFLLLNNDTEVITPTWIDRMVGICQRNDVGAVGVCLYYIDETIQHAGVAISIKGPGHLQRALPRGSYGYYAMAGKDQNLSAVTAACMMTKRSVFEQVGGFTEEFGVAFNDVDYCLKVRDIDQLIVYTPEVELYHYESASRGYETTLAKQERFLREETLLKNKWAHFFVHGDPYYNKNFCQEMPKCYYYCLP